MQALINLGLDPTMCRAQTYDGAGNMAGCQNGCAKRFQEVSSRALYFHCASHELNLALSHASKVADIYHMVCTLKSVGILFKYSPSNSESSNNALRVSARERKIPVKVNVKLAVMQLPQMKTMAQKTMIMEIPRKKEMK